MKIVETIKEWLTIIEPEERKWVFQGAMIPIAISSTLILCGIIWSIVEISGIGFIDHLYNGWVVLVMASMLALFLGVPSVIFMLHALGRKKAPYWRLGGFLPPFILITALVWNYGNVEFREAPKPASKFKIHLKWP